jgi:hypothetical protein
MRPQRYVRGTLARTGSMYIANPATQASIHPQRDGATEELTGFVLYLGR